MAVCDGSFGYSQPQRMALWCSFIVVFSFVFLGFVVSGITFGRNRHDDARVISSNQLLDDIGRGIAHPTAETSTSIPAPIQTSSDLPMTTRPKSSHANGNQSLIAPDTTACTLNGNQGFRCPNSHCLPLDKLCDDKVDCAGAEDEPPDWCSCDGMMCNVTNQCVPSAYVCDGDPSDCDGLDEQGCPEIRYQPCQSDEFRCHNGLCIPDYWRCDTHLDCPKREDEIDCTTRTCPDGYFRCTSGSCIKQSWVCDGQEECQDGADESQSLCNPSCGGNEFECSPGQCVPKSQVCNNRNDCVNGKDEMDCQQPAQTCKEGEYACKGAVSMCIPEDFVCDGKFDDCPNGDDEKHCECSGNKMECSDGVTCIGLDKLCNNVEDCPSGEDEQDCGCRLNEHHCLDGSCIPTSAVCNGETDCSDASDEASCPCRRDQFQCVQDGLCVSASARCDGQFDCRDLTDELDCATQPPACNKSSHFKCSSGACIPNRGVCDGIEDCSTGEDEIDCPRCAQSEFKCSTGQCISTSMLCDLKVDCLPGGEDEGRAKCGHSICNSALGFVCNDGKCVNRSAVCDKKNDCTESKDEIDCFIPTLSVVEEMESLKDDLDGLQNHINHVEQKVDKFGKEVDKLGHAIDDLEEQITELERTNGRRSVKSPTTNGRRSVRHPKRTRGRPNPRPTRSTLRRSLRALRQP